MGVAVQAELACNVCGKRLQYSEVVCCNVALNEADLLFCACKFARLASFGVCEHFIQLGDELLDSGNEFNETFGDEYGTEVVSILGTVCYNLCEVGNHVVERHFLLLNFFRNQTCVGLGLECAFQSNVRSRASHKLDEVPVLACTVAVALDVTDEFAIGLAGSIETEAGFNLLVLEVTVDGLGASDYLYTIVLGSIVLGQNASVGV